MINSKAILQRKH
uniref:Uncharacterized protein n=1 Tax=Lepeophtheirus salmonis TaxID=72036 RepID=A0A0K2URV7_LEPSM